MLVSMETYYNCEPMLFTRYVFMKNKVIGEKKMNFEKNCSYNRILPNPRYSNSIHTNLIDQLQKKNVFLWFWTVIIQSFEQNADLALGL